MTKKKKAYVFISSQAFVTGEKKSVSMAGFVSLSSRTNRVASVPTEVGPCQMNKAVI